MENQSFWQEIEAPRFEPLQDDMEVDAVVVGAGLCGLLCAYFLRRKGVNVAIIDADEVCNGRSPAGSVTAYTSAKITSQHGLIYAKLLQGMGSEAAAQYADANQTAIRQYQAIIERERIDCNFTASNAWVYTTQDAFVQAIEDEVDAAQRLGINAVFGTQTELPFPVKAAVRFPHQAYFHPLKFAFAICDILSKAGCQIYTHTRALSAEIGIVRTEQGNIHAKHIISCTRYPFIDKASLLFTKVFQQRSYVLALKGAAVIHDMYIDCAEGGLSFRPHQDMLLFSAYDHKTGHDEDMLHYDTLIQQARSCYPRCEVAYQWSAQDCMTHDNIPYIGRYHSAGSDIYLATGFNKWGMTSSMAAAEIISEQITCGGHKHAPVFSLSRQDIGLQAGSFAKETIDIIGNFLAHLSIDDKRLQDIKNDQGGIVEIDGRRVGIYRDNDGVLHAVNPVCTHMGCTIQWNKDENTWDCTCHGSRFDYEGNVIGGPAMVPLKGLIVTKA